MVQQASNSSTSTFKVWREERPNMERTVPKISRRERWQGYNESPLVVCAVSKKKQPTSLQTTPTTTTTTTTTSSGMTKSRQQLQPSESQRVTPSPMVTQEGDAILESTNSLSSIEKRQLFQSPKKRKSCTSSPTEYSTIMSNPHPPSEHQHQHQQQRQSPIVSPARRRLFRPCPPKDDVVNIQHQSPEKVVDLPTRSHTTRKESLQPASKVRIVSPTRKIVEKPLFGIRSWESVMSVNSIPSSSSRRLDSHSVCEGGQTSVSSSPEEEETEVQSPAAKKALSPELISLLALPVTMDKSSKRRRPKTHGDILKKANARRKTLGIPRRETLPRRCKTHTRRNIISLMEESDDDFYFDTLRHSEIMMKKKIPDSSVATTSVVVPTTTSTTADRRSSSPSSSSSSFPPMAELERSTDTKVSAQAHREALSVSPLTESEPTDTNLTLQTGRRTSSTSRVVESEPTNSKISAQTDKDKESMVVPIRPKRDRSPKIRAIAKKPIKGKIQDVQDRRRIVRAQIQEAPSVQPSPSSTPPNEQLHRVTAQEDSPSVDDVMTPSDQEEEEEVAADPSEAVINVTTSTSRSVGRTPSKANKVRFAPMTTTFSLEIRVKTSSRPRRGKGEKLRPPSLSQSTVQTIANEITRAYLAQEATAADDESTDGHGDEEGSETEILPTKGKDDEQCEAIYLDPQILQVSQTRLKEAPSPRTNDAAHDDGYDTRSAASEITMDIELLQGAREFTVNRERLKSPPEALNGAISTNHDVQDPGPEIQNDDNDDSDDDVEEYQPHKSRRLVDLSRPRNTDLSTRPPKRSGRQRMGSNPTGGLFGSVSSNREVVETDQKPSPVQRRRRFFRSTDSLAGCSLASLNSVKSAAVERIPNNIVTATKVPGEVSVSTSRTERHESSHRSLFATLPVTEPQNDMAFLNSKTTQQCGTGRNGCGKCPGCRLEYDCLACSVCIHRLQQGRLMDQEEGCLRRICRLSQARPMDTLGRTFGIPGDDHRTSSAHSITPSSPRYGNGTEMRNDDDKETNNDNNDGETSVISCFNDTESVYSTTSKKRRSRSARFWSRHWAEERQKTMLAQTAAGGASEDKGSAAFRGNGNEIDNLLVATGTGGSKKRGTRGKHSKNILHNLALPMPTDGSVASAMASRRALHALMQYDEADQDWI